MKKKSRITGLIAIMMVATLLAGLLPAVAFADYTEYSVGTMWPSSKRTFPRDVTVVNCDRLVIREYADFSAREVLSATRGRHFTATGMSGNFIQVRLDDGTLAYGYGSYLQPGAELSGAAVAPNPWIHNTPFGGYVSFPYYWHVMPHRPDPRPPHPQPHPKPPVPNPPGPPHPKPNPLPPAP